MKTRKLDLLKESLSGMSWFELMGWLPSRGIPDNEADRRYLSGAGTLLSWVGACFVSGWAFVHWSILIATIVFIGSFVTAFIVALWAVGRILPPKIRSGR